MNLDIAEHRKLLDLTSAADIETVEFMGEFDDDHIACVTAKINGVGVDIYWCGCEGVAAVMYANEVDRAREKVFELLRSEIHITLEVMFDASDDDLRNEIIEHRESYEAALEYIRRHGSESDIWKEVAGHAPFGGLVDVDKMVLTFTQ